MYKGELLKWQSARFAFERHRDRYPDSPISFSLQLFSLPIATQVFCAKQKRLENRTNMQGGLAQVVERSIRIRQAPGWRPGYSNWLLFTIIFIANFNASLLCQTEKLEEQKQCPRGISSSGRALDLHSRGTGIETRIIQLVNLWRIEKMYKGEYNYSRYQLFSLPISTQVCCAKQKRLKNSNICPRGISSSGRALDSNSRGTGIDTRILYISFSLQLFSLPIAIQVFLCQTEKVGEWNKYARGISSGGRELDSHSRGTAIETRILQLVILFNYFHCQFQRKFVVPNRKG